jgi:hypothetical protein
MEVFASADNCIDRACGQTLCAAYADQFINHGHAGYGFLSNLGVNWANRCFEEAS